MSRQIGDSITILNANAADVTQANAAWHNMAEPDQVVFDVAITGTATVTLDFDFHGTNAATRSENFAASNQYVLDDPAKQVRAYSNNCGANEACVVQMQRIYFNRR